ncbi:hypothetical protein FCM35_KLT13214 [Carex littledalei]|uniref:Uncharacterized protein n=1 Tax=Carex littledalei TaxID=544730 RepID=A0A833QM27_9POAL|nr:hypothetical protein FCM35_KLT13214 [Carex littledalei]
MKCIRDCSCVGLQYMKSIRTCSLKSSLNNGNTYPSHWGTIYLKVPVTMKMLGSSIPQSGLEVTEVRNPSCNASHDVTKHISKTSTKSQGSATTENYEKDKRSHLAILDKDVLADECDWKCYKTSAITIDIDI